MIRSPKVDVGYVHSVYTTCLECRDSNRVDRFENGSRNRPLEADVSIDTLHVSIDTCLTSGTPLPYHASIDTWDVSIDTWHVHSVDRYSRVSIDTVYNQVCRSTHLCVVRHLGAVRLGMNASGCVFRVSLQRMLARSG